MIGYLRDIVLRRRNAYRALFAPDGNLSPAARIVMADLAKFCRDTRSTIVVSPITQTVDPIASALAEGRREVFLRIKSHVNISDADLFSMMEIERRKDDDAQ